MIDRDTNKFEILHLPECSVACTTHKIEDVRQCSSSLQENLKSLKRPVILCHLLEPTRYIPSGQIAVELISSAHSCREYVILKNGSTQGDLKKRLDEIRNLKFQIVDSSSILSFGYKVEIQQQQTSLEIFKSSNTQWKKFILVEINVLEGVEETVGITINMLVNEDSQIDEIKTAIIEFQRYVCCREVLMEMEKMESDPSMVTEALKRLCLMRKPLISLVINRNRRKLPDAETVKKMDISSIEKLTVLHKFPSNIQLDMSIKYADVSAFMDSETLLVLSVTDDSPAVVMLRDDLKEFKHITDKISNCIDSGCRLLMLKDNTIVTTIETVMDDVDDIVHYATIFPFNNVTLLECVGQGAYGTVHKCSVADKKSSFAIKKILAEDKNCSESCNNILTEIAVVSQIGSHRRIMAYHRFYEDESSFYILMDLMEDSLSAYVSRLHPLKEYEILRIALQILEGLKHIHDHKIVHRDLKGPNVLLDAIGNIKLSDFGVAKHLAVDTREASNKGAKTKVGSFNWTAPEVAKKGHKSYGLKADIWSFGAVLVEMITGKPPFPKLSGIQVIMKLSLKKEIPYVFPKNRLSQELEVFVKYILNPKIDSRPDCDILLDHSIFK